MKSKKRSGIVSTTIPLSMHESWKEPSEQFRTRNLILS